MLSSFVFRHLGPRPNDIDAMLGSLGFKSLDELVGRSVPRLIRSDRSLSTDIIGPGKSEFEVLEELRTLASQNQVLRSYIGMGYSDCFTPPVIQRNILEDPRWYTPYTPYQSEVSQGRLEALLNFQTMVADLTGMEIANASLLDEGTAAAEAMSMCLAIKGREGKAFFVADNCHPVTIAVLQTRAEPLGVELIIGSHEDIPHDRDLCGALLQYPATDGVIYDYTAAIAAIHEAGALAVVAADILSLALIRPPGEMDADIVIGNTQRFGVPLGYGGPHAAYLATRSAFSRQIPGRLVGVSRDRDGRPAVRLALQTREQHIRRDRATSNICTAQVLLAVVAGMYAVYHGPQGIREIACRVHDQAWDLATRLRGMGFRVGEEPIFDTVKVPVERERQGAILRRARDRGINLRTLDPETLCVSLDETTTTEDVAELTEVLSGEPAAPGGAEAAPPFPAGIARESPILTHAVFNRYHSETEMLRYMNRLQSRDLSLATSMIPLGSCTMKLNATAEMMPISWPGFNRIHPYAPLEQARGYREVIRRLEAMLAEITGFDAISLQPNAGSQGEYAGLLVIRRFHQERGESHRNVCLIPKSAHGTNPASAAMAGMRIVAVETDRSGNVDLEDLKRLAEVHRDTLAALMITYPSTHGVFEGAIVEICETVHRCGGQVYLDGANLNAQVGLCRPGDYGADVAHLNLHKTFCIPHGGGGPGMGPIGVKAHLRPYLPGHPLVSTGGEHAIGPVSSAPWGSPSILPISYAYIAMMGVDGLKMASQVAILNANYLAHRLEPYYPVLYRGDAGLVAHECILDLRPLKQTAGVEVEDVAKRLIDYGFHAPTVSFPVPGTLMVEPTESESKEELDRFCDAMIGIRKEISAIERGDADRQDNLLKNAPHTADQALSSNWERPYSREQAVFPTEFTRLWKYWSPVARVDNVYGERNLVCSCLPVEEMETP